MILSFSLGNQLIGDKNIDKDKNIYVLKYPCNNTETCTYYKSFFPPGSYKLEAWGAQGGLNGGKGGYSKGILTLDEPTNVYFFVGSKGSEANETGMLTGKAYNGGGSGATATTNLTRKAGSGGGASDIRLNGLTYNHRIIVAGGGGGATKVQDYTETDELGHGGGSEGISPGTGAEGGTQEESPQNLNEGLIPGSFGEGGSMTNTDKTGGGGGGGWYGGSSGLSNDMAGYGAGGSGYVLHSQSYKPYGYFLNSSRYFLKNYSTLDGSNLFSSCDIGSEPYEMEKGHRGNGCLRITVLYITSYSNISYYTLSPFLIMFVVIKI